VASWVAARASSRRPRADSANPRSTSRPPRASSSGAQRSSRARATAKLSSRSTTVRSVGSRNRSVEGLQLRGPEVPRLRVERPLHRRGHRPTGLRRHLHGRPPEPHQPPRQRPVEPPRPPRPRREPGQHGQRVRRIGLRLLQDRVHEPRPLPQRPVDHVLPEQVGLERSHPRPLLADLPVQSPHHPPVVGPLSLGRPERQRCVERLHGGPVPQHQRRHQRLELAPSIGRQRAPRLLLQGVQPVPPLVPEHPVQQRVHRQRPIQPRPLGELHQRGHLQVQRQRHRRLVGQPLGRRRTLGHPVEPQQRLPGQVRPRLRPQRLAIGDLLDRAEPQRVRARGEDVGQLGIGVGEVRPPVARRPREQQQPHLRSRVGAPPGLLQRPQQPPHRAEPGLGVVDGHQQRRPHLRPREPLKRSLAGPSVEEPGVPPDRVALGRQLLREPRLADPARPVHELHRQRPVAVEPPVEPRAHGGPPRERHDALAREEQRGRGARYVAAQPVHESIRQPHPLDELPHHPHEPRSQRLGRGLPLVPGQPRERLPGPHLVPAQAPGHHGQQREPRVRLLAGEQPSHLVLAPLAVQRLSRQQHDRAVAGAHPLQRPRFPVVAEVDAHVLQQVRPDLLELGLQLREQRPRGVRPPTVADEHLGLRQGPSLPRVSVHRFTDGEVGQAIASSTASSSSSSSVAGASAPPAPSDDRSVRRRRRYCEASACWSSTGLTSPYRVSTSPTGTLG